MALAAMAAGDFDPHDMFIDENDKHFKEHEMHSLYVENKNLALIKDVSEGKVASGVVSKQECGFLVGIIAQKHSDAASGPMPLQKHINYMTIQSVYLCIPRHRNAALVCFGCWFAEGSISPRDLGMVAGIVDVQKLDELRGKRPIDIWGESDEEIARLARIVAEACGVSVIDDANFDQLESHALGKSTIWTLFFQVVFALVASLAGMPLFVATAVAASPTTDQMEWRIAETTYNVNWADGSRTSVGYLEPNQWAGGANDHTQDIIVLKQAVDIVRRKYKSRIIEENHVQKVKDVGFALTGPVRVLEGLWTKFAGSDGNAGTTAILMTIGSRLGENIQRVFAESWAMGGDLFYSAPTLFYQLFAVTMSNMMYLHAANRAEGYNRIFLPWTPGLGQAAGLFSTGQRLIPARYDWIFWERMSAFFLAKLADAEAATWQYDTKKQIEELVTNAKAEIYLDVKRQMINLLNETDADVLRLHADLDVNDFANAFDTAAYNAGFTLAYDDDSTDYFVGKWEECALSPIKTRRWILHMEMVMTDCLGTQNNYAENMKKLAGESRWDNIVQAGGAVVNWFSGNTDLVSTRNANFREHLTRKLGTSAEQAKMIIGNKINLAIRQRKIITDKMPNYKAIVDSDYSFLGKAVENVDKSWIFHIIPLSPIVRILHSTYTLDLMTAMTTLMGMFLMYYYCFIAVVLGHRSLGEQLMDSVERNIVRKVRAEQNEALAHDINVAKETEKLHQAKSESTADALNSDSSITITKKQSVTDENGRTITQESIIEATGEAAKIAAKNIGNNGNQGLTEKEMRLLKYKKEDEGIDDNDQ